MLEEHPTGLLGTAPLGADRDDQPRTDLTDSSAKGSKRDVARPWDRPIAILIRLAHVDDLDIARTVEQVEQPPDPQPAL